MFSDFHKHETNTPQNAFIFEFNALLCGNKNWLTIKKLLRIASFHHSFMCVFIISLALSIYKYWEHITLLV